MGNKESSKSHRPSRHHDLGRRFPGGPVDRRKNEAKEGTHPRYRLSHGLAVKKGPRKLLPRGTGLRLRTPQPDSVFLGISVCSQCLFVAKYRSMIKRFVLYFWLRGSHIWLNIPKD